MDPISTMIIIVIIVFDLRCPRTLRDEEISEMLPSFSVETPNPEHLGGSSLSTDDVESLSVRAPVPSNLFWVRSFSPTTPPFRVNRLDLESFLFL